MLIRKPTGIDPVAGIFVDYAFITVEMIFERLEEALKGNAGIVTIGLPAVQLYDWGVNIGIAVRKHEEKKIIL